MRFKLDENFGTRSLRVFEKYHHDIQTVRQEHIEGIPDRELYDLCIEERRCLVTLDLDFANSISFPPSRTEGIVVIRIPKNPSLSTLENMITQFLAALKHDSISELLWIVEVGRIRIHRGTSENNDA